MPVFLLLNKVIKVKLYDILGSKSTKKHQDGKTGSSMEENKVKKKEKKLIF